MKLGSFKLKFSVFVILSFIVFTIVGTLTHELGHIIVAKYLGYNTTLNYGSMYYTPDGFDVDADVIKHKELFIKNSNEIKNELPFEDEELLKYHLDRIHKKFPSKEEHNLLIAIGGPAQTIITCLLGLLILFYRKSKYRSLFKFLDWLGVYLGLFILREVFNTIMAFIKVLISSEMYFAGDEFGISRLLNLNQWVLPIITMLIGILITVYIIFKIIPIRYRVSFIISGFIGGVLGYSIWFGFLGHLLFPSPISF